MKIDELILNIKTYIDAIDETMHLDDANLEDYISQILYNNGIVDDEQKNLYDNLCLSISMQDYQAMHYYAESILAWYIVDSAKAFLAGFED